MSCIQVDEEKGQCIKLVDTTISYCVNILATIELCKRKKQLLSGQITNKLSSVCYKTNTLMS